MATLRYRWEQWEEEEGGGECWEVRTEDKGRGRRGRGRVRTEDKGQGEEREREGEEEHFLTSFLVGLVRRLSVGARLELAWGPSLGAQPEPGRARTSPDEPGRARTSPDEPGQAGQMHKLIVKLSTLNKPFININQIIEVPRPNYGS